MPQPVAHLPVHGRTVHTPHGPLLILTERLEGHDTFLTTHFHPEHKDLPPVPVRILTFDDTTVLSPTTPDAPVPSGTWSGRLDLPHGARPLLLPQDLHEAARAAGRDTTALDEAETRYALTFLTEATTPDIRQARIDAIIQALPAPAT